MRISTLLIASLCLTPLVAQEGFSKQQRAELREIIRQELRTAMHEVHAVHATPAKTEVAEKAHRILAQQLHGDLGENMRIVRALPKPTEHGLEWIQLHQRGEQKPAKTVHKNKVVRLENFVHGKEIVRLDDVTHGEEAKIVLDIPRKISTDAQGRMTIMLDTKTGDSPHQKSAHKVETRAYAIKDGKIIELKGNPHGAGAFKFHTDTDNSHGHDNDNGHDHDDDHGHGHGVDTIQFHHGDGEGKTQVHTEAGVMVFSKDGEVFKAIDLSKMKNGSQAQGLLQFHPEIKMQSTKSGAFTFQVHQGDGEAHAAIECPHPTTEHCEGTEHCEREKECCEGEECEECEECEGEECEGCQAETSKPALKKISQLNVEIEAIAELRKEIAKISAELAAIEQERAAKRKIERELERLR